MVQLRKIILTKKKNNKLYNELKILNFQSEYT